MEERAPKLVLAPRFRPALRRIRGRRARIVLVPAVVGGATSPGQLSYAFSPSNPSICGTSADVQGLFVPDQANGDTGLVGSGPGLTFNCSAGAGMSADYNWAATGYGYGPYFGYGGYFGWSATAPAGMYIDNVSAEFSVIDQEAVGYGGLGWFGETYVDGQPATSLTNNTYFGTQDTQVDDQVDGPTWSWQFTCGFIDDEGDTVCENSTAGGTSDLELTATETTHPSIAVAGNLAKTGGWVWNPPADPFSLAVSSSDPSGVCGLTATLGGKQLVATAGDNNPASQWKICDDASSTVPVDLNSLATGAQTLAAHATSGADLSSSQTHTVYVDNTPVSVALATPNDRNPTVWVNHPVTVTQTTTAGPSGVGGTNCQVDQQPVFAYAGAFSVNGTGEHVVSCTGWNQASDPQGNPRTGSSSDTIAIDETPPSLAFAPQVPEDPAQIVADTSDAQSGVAGGSIQIAPAGSSSWTRLPTSFSGQQLIAQIPDAHKHGAWVIQATSCDVAGNCTSTDEPVTLPLRTAATSTVGFQKIKAPAKVIKRRVLVGWHWGQVRFRGHRVRAKIGGHKITIRVVVHPNRRCARRQVKIGRHHWKQLNLCRQVKILTVRGQYVRHGHTAKIHGLLTSNGVPLANTPVLLATRPQVPHSRFRTWTTVTTNTAGQWSAKLHQGPSRIIRASYAGSATLLPAVGTATTTTPAKIVLQITPTVLPWDKQVHITGHLAGGYLPHGHGVALEGHVFYPHHKTGLLRFSFRTNHKGRFSYYFGYGAGRGVYTVRFQIETIGSEPAYPWAPAKSTMVPVTFGKPTPQHASHRVHHKTSHAKAGS